MNLTEGTHLVHLARQRQFAKHGYDAEHDAEHDDSELVTAGICYAMEAIQPGEGNGLWPWQPDEWHPDPDPLDNLVKAAALMVAEIDAILLRRGQIAEAYRANLRKHGDAS